MRFGGGRRSGSVFLDPRGDMRVLRVTWHAEDELVVLSLWRENLCAGTFRLPAEDVPALIRTLAEALPDPLAVDAG